MSDAVRELAERWFVKAHMLEEDRCFPAGFERRMCARELLAALEAAPEVALERAVVDAADRWERIYSEPFDPETASSGEWHKEGSALRQLRGAVRAYRAALDRARKGGE